MFDRTDWLRFTWHRKLVTWTSSVNCWNVERQLMSWPRSVSSDQGQSQVRTEHAAAKQVNNAIGIKMHPVKCYDVVFLVFKLNGLIVASCNTRLVCIQACQENWRTILCVTRDWYSIIMKHSTWSSTLHVISVLWCCMMLQKGNSSLHIAALAGHRDIVELLVRHGAKVNQQSTVAH